MIGSTIGAYQVLGKIGEGGMGAVYSAAHTLLGRRAAIKVLLPEFSLRADIVERFFNEARASTAIGDLGIVQVFDFGYHAGSAYLVMELLDGESLEARLRRVGALSVRDSLRLVRQLAQTLAAVHARGVIHRDLKPDNIFIVSDREAEAGERPKILDFGIAKLAEGEQSASKTRTGSVVGTPLYMSPEQCRGAGKLDHRSDIYSLGCVMFHVLCGRPPFNGEGPGDVLISHVTRPAPVPSETHVGLPPAVDEIVARCLAKDPADRYQDMNELARAVATVQAQITGAPLVVADGTGDWRRISTAPAPTTLSSAAGVAATATSPSSRRFVPIVVAVSLAVAGTIAGVMILGRDREPPPSAGAGPTSTPPDAGPDAAIDALVHVDASIAIAADAAPLVADDAAVKPPVDAAPKRKPRRVPVKPVEDPYALPK